ncbi:VCBS repeat-containing protein [Pontibacter anaerobius]|uniref:VCBS repeat-containing protein n=1 Tax=Pontibacter anaerobius TaxID=2993940 RepID=A0ABT3RF24_9BACT|nr:VCBS repeat-containing protein [Pontibacter anaerobius]MCX2740058.1 VCBS repeat-containing protein [Pontibacter anaerobius]
MVKRINPKATLGLLLILCFACNKKTPRQEATLFEELAASATNVDFINNVESNEEMNIFNYRNFYNGGGVAIGDVNNDGLPDIYLTSNTGQNRLYLNKGGFKFEDVTELAGVGGNQAWSTGVTMADVNGDGLLDIYVCNAGEVNGDNRKNELFINNGITGQGIPSFSEKATAYSLDDEGFSTHATFFDYDRDGDLDVYLLNNSSYPVSSLGYTNLRTKRNSLGGDKLLRNDNGIFTDVSEEAGIYGSLIGFGLGITIGDVNNDNWLDIFISNDFYERDYLYINNQNGTFTEASKEWMPHESLSSMGADIADLNNDEYQDIFVTDMLPGNDARLKRTSTYENYDLQQLKLSRDFHYQYMQNMLHLNNGDNTFSEVARLAGVHATDWSWGALLFDMDNDGLKDIFVANGIYQDLTDQDFVNFLGNEETMRKAAEGGGGYKYNKELISKMTSTPIPNYAFQNKGNLQFENQAKNWGLGKPGFSNGAAYGDLDNDGDLDLVVNNVNMPVSIYKNNASERLGNHFLRVKLKGGQANLNGIGAKVYVYQPGKTVYLQQMPNRGFESSVDLTLVFGLGKEAVIDSVRVIWPDDNMQVLQQVKPDQDLILGYQQADKLYTPEKKNPGKPFYDATEAVKLAYAHQESNFVDYNRDALLKQMFSTQGPALATGDVNGDGLDDVYVGGAAGGDKKLFLQQKDGTFVEAASVVFEADRASEDIAAKFFDADGDRDLDLMVVTGSNEFVANAPQLLDRLYINDGKGNFKKENRLPNLETNASCVAAADFDQDGDIDLFIGGRMIPGGYGYAPPSYLYVNDGTGNFKNYTKRYLPANELGMISEAVWVDLNGDTYPELVMVGDWMPVTVFANEKGRSLKSKTEVPNSSGWWNTIKTADVDNDGDTDFILGNLGRNSRLAASQKQPVEMYVHDFEGNGTVEQIINCYAEDGKAYPMILKQDLQKQVPSIKKKFVKHVDYAGKQLHEILPEEELKKAVVRKVDNPNSSFLINDGNMKFSLKALPVEVQFSPIHAIETLDYNQDGHLDILLAGNFLDVLPELGQYDANYGLVLQGKGNGLYDVVKSKESGFFTKGQVRRMGQVRNAKGEVYFLLGKNNDKLQVVSTRR